MGPGGSNPSPTADFPSRPGSPGRVFFFCPSDPRADRPDARGPASGAQTGIVAEEAGEAPCLEGDSVVVR